MAADLAPRDWEVTTLSGHGMQCICPECDEIVRHATREWMDFYHPQQEVTTLSEQAFTPYAVEPEAHYPTEASRLQALFSARMSDERVPGWHAHIPVRSSRPWDYVNGIVRDLRKKTGLPA